ncbi:MAG: hypothetical protein S4CHLAM102_00160 [Chlamydiia bacterium]|nr:hypothetical protein [Chlamydiia bacterium]
MSAFVAVHLLSAYFEIFLRKWHGRVLTFLNGVSVSYVFMEILPHLCRTQTELNQRFAPNSERLNTQVFGVALVGFMFYFGIQTWSARNRLEKPASLVWVELVPFFLVLFGYSLVNFGAGYTVVFVTDPDIQPLYLYVLVISAHILLNDHSMTVTFGRLHALIGKWVLAGAVVAGWIFGHFFHLPMILTGLILAFIGGAIILNVLRDDLPKELYSRYSDFVLGAAFNAFIALVLQHVL